MDKEEYYLSSLRRRQAVRAKLSKHPALYSIGKTFHRGYCQLTHFLHTYPDFLIIGVPKSATTALFQYLLQHPSISPPLTKQIHFFDRYFSRGTAWYKNCLPYKWEKFKLEKIQKCGFATGEATIHYMLHPLAPERVKNLIPNVKLIVILRNPVDRAYSHYQMEFANKNENFLFEEILKEEPKRLNGEFEKLTNDENYDSLEYPHRAYLATGHYAEHLKRWFKYFPREQFLIIKNEEFLSDISKGYNEVLDFLNLPSFDLPEYKKIHSRKYEKMKPETRQKLIEYFHPYNKELYKLLDRDFGWDN